MNQINKNMLNAIDQVIFDKKARFKNDVYEAIGTTRQRVNDIKYNGTNFTIENIDLFCKTYDVQPNYIFGISNEIYSVQNSVQITQ